MTMKRTFYHTPHAMVLTRTEAKVLRFVERHWQFPSNEKIAEHMEWKDPYYVTGILIRLKAFGRLKKVDGKWEIVSRHRPARRAA